MLTELEKKIIAAIQGDIPVAKRPYLEMAAELGVSEENFLNTLQSLMDRGVIRRFGATLRHQKSGFGANAMVAWRVGEDQIEQVGREMAALREVSHCYRRNPTHQWPYNLYTMVHAKTEAACRKIAERMSEKTSVHQYALLFSIKELKKTSMQYFSDENDF
ncbi:MAG: Lrp/AsnC family transcriptional regulator [Desulfobacterales bacterium]|nr:Lrp/AsnC family transcriptional regulator [Desulfobacterales bacterium]